MPLEFKHPRLGITATRSGPRLIIQNDIGTTDAHVVVIHVEGDAVNAVISKRFAKCQQMQWTKRGRHLLLQTRTRTLDGTFRPLFER